ncbi:MAG: DNA methyltransferase [Lamprobacter sp.]|uniref:DNA-methyltransferase n=1 Tax=Lamprobacter sp. TaxID=3100796 RepID=UPI002B25A12C|nr:DNA methyltransferase [Lamprobacter sp.]MEA3641862.1 DNA methyltransferase [Lamprobacter sp.]
MAVKTHLITDQFAIYNGDCIEVMGSLPDGAADLSVYSPPFAGLYQYSSDDRDLSNAIDFDEFFAHYGFVIDQLSRLTKPGRISAVHCMDIPLSNSGCDAMFDLPGRIILEHERRGFTYGGRFVIWKEPLMVRNRTMMKSLHHKTLCEDSTRVSIANADYLMMFRRKGANTIPVTHETGLDRYAGERQPQASLHHLRGMVGDQKQNQFSQYIWRQYASSVWDDIRIDRVLPYREAKEGEDEKHVHPLQLDVIERAVTLWSNPGETVVTPFMGVGSEVYGAVQLGRKAIGAELKTAYYQQAVLNLQSLDAPSAVDASQCDLFGSMDDAA